MDWKNIPHCEAVKRFMEIAACGLHPFLIVSPHEIINQILLDSFSTILPDKDRCMVRGNIGHARKRKIIYDWWGKYVPDIHVGYAMICRCGPIDPQTCICTTPSKLKYRKRIIEMAKQFQMYLEFDIPNLKVRDEAESSQAVANRVWMCREAMKTLKKVTPRLDVHAGNLFKVTVEKLKLDGPKQRKILRVAGTIAIMDKLHTWDGRIEAQHITEAIQYKLPRR